MSHHHSAASAHRTIAGLYGLIGVLCALLVFFTVEDGKWWALLFPLALVVPVSLHLLIARGADRCQPWARVASIVMGVLLLPGIPIGTAMGIWLLTNAIPAWLAEPRYSGSLTDGWPQAQPPSPPVPSQEAVQTPAREPETA